MTHCDPSIPIHINVLCYQNNNDIIIITFDPLTYDMLTYLFDIKFGSIIICWWEVSETMGAINAMPMECTMLHGDMRKQDGNDDEGSGIFHT